MLKCDSECNWASAEAVLPASGGLFQQHHEGHCEGVYGSWQPSHVSFTSSLDVFGSSWFIQRNT